MVVFVILFFFKANSWSSSVNEIEGVVTDSKGMVVHSIFGKWHESVFQGDPPTAMCIWRASKWFFHADFTHPEMIFITKCVCVCFRPYATGPRAVLWLHPVCNGVKWAGFHCETSFASHRHEIQARPEVGNVHFSFFGNITRTIPSSFPDITTVQSNGCCQLNRFLCGCFSNILADVEPVILDSRIPTGHCKNSISAKISTSDTLCVAIAGKSHSC